MVDKKLSEFNSVSKSDVSDLVVLYNNNGNIRNGRLAISVLDDTYASLTNDNTFSGNVTFSNPVVATVSRATADSNGNSIISTYATKAELKQKIPYKLFQCYWFDYEIDDQSWLCSNTFSWQDGTVYSDAYNHLVDDIDGKTATTETVDGTTVTYYLADDGHKIVDVADVSAIETVYISTGVAWYYVLDTANQRFKLPRENPAREELIQTVRAKGSGVALGISNGTNNYGVISTQYTASTAMYQGRSSDAYGVETGTSGFGTGTTITSGIALGLTSDSNNSGIISNMADSTSVYKGNKYLYFYVGQFSQTATEQTAGLNAELFNGKADIDLSNISATAKESIFGWGMPDYSAGISVSYSELNSGFTAPYDGVLLCNFSLNGTVTINSLSFTAELDYPNRQLREIHLNRGDIIKTTTLTARYGGENMFFPLKGVDNA